jgi:hypothetical protein
MKSFRTIIAAVAFVALTQVQGETPALRGLDETKNAPNAVDVNQPDRYIYCPKWPYDCIPRA